MNFYKKLIQLTLAALFTLSCFLVFLPVNVSALNATDEAKYDYELAVASQILLACNVRQEIKKSDYGRLTWADGGRKYDVSAVWTGSFDTEVEGQIDCNTPGDMRTVFKILGFDSQQDINAFLAPQRGPDSRCNGDVCSFRDNWKTELWEEVRNRNGRPGPDNSVTSTSLAGQYYFWSKSFKDGMCRGNVYSKQSTYDNKPENQRTRGPIYWYEAGQVNEKIGAGFIDIGEDAYQELGPDYFNQENIRTMIAGGAPLETNLIWYSDSRGDNKATCADMIGVLKDRRYADAMKQLFEEKQAAGEEGGESFVFANVFDADKQEDENQKTCTQNVGLSGAWIPCTVTEFAAKSIESIFSVVDRMLDVDGQNLYNDESLRTIWSYFRVIATFSLLIIGLIMVISQAIGGGL